MTRIRLVSFDVDQTLLDFRRTLSEALDAVASLLNARAGLALNSQALQHIRNQIAAARHGRATEMLTLRRMSFEKALHGHSDANRLTNEAMDLFEKIRFGRVYPLPGALDLLESLHTQIPMAALTNGNSDPSRAGIGRFFEHVVLAEEFAFQKPDPRIFHVLRKRANLAEPVEMLHVGDQLQADILGANRAGAVSVWYNPDGLENKTDIHPDFEISSLQQVAALL